MKRVAPWMRTASFFFFALLFFSCKGSDDKDEKRIVAKAYGNTLSEKELQERIPRSLSKADSKEVAETAVRNWIREQVLLRKAEEELSQDEKKLQERIEAYRRSLMIHSLEKKNVRKKLDTQISAKELKSFYQAHKKDLILDEPILRKLHVQLKKDSIRYLSKFIVGLRKDSSERKDAIEEACRERAVDHSLEGNDWMRMGEFLTRFPLDIRDRERFLKKRKVQRFDREENVFLLRILDHRSRNDTAPLSLVRDRVRNMIINERKRTIIDKLHQNAVLDAKKNEEVQVH